VRVYGQTLRGVRRRNFVANSFVLEHGRLGGSAQEMPSAFQEYVVATRIWISLLAFVLSGTFWADSTDLANAQQAPADCRAFSTFDEANAYYAENPHADVALDDDGDGTACEVFFGIERREDLSGAIAAPAADGSLDDAVHFAQEADGDLDCEDFETQEEAQAVFAEDAADPHNLDPNGDGIACALLPAAQDLDSSAGLDAGAEQEAVDANQTQEERRAARQAERQAQGQQNEDGQPAEEETVNLTCADFVTAEDAQAEFDEDPEALAELDGDGNGIACEELLEVAPADDAETPQERRNNRRNQEEEPAPVEVVVDEPEPVRIQEDFDCVDFEFQEEAQEIYDQDPSDPYNLDPNGDGFPCSSLPSSGPRVTQVPRTGVGSSIGNNAGLLAAATLVTCLGVIGGSWRRISS
jgi:hypothetical protein